jgi:hypothetical protein
LPSHVSEIHFKQHGDANDGFYFLKAKAFSSFNGAFHYSSAAAVAVFVS